MAISFPLDLLADFPGWAVTFDLAYRQETSRAASGRTRVKDLGSPLWRGSWVSKRLSANALDYWRARLELLENGGETFIAWCSSRSRPIAHPGAASLPTGALHTIGGNNKSIRVSGLTDITLSVGDLIEIGTRNLYRVAEAAAGGGTGLTGTFEVRPHLWLGTATSQTVKISKPACLMAIEPGSVSVQADLAGRGSVSFSGYEAR